MTFHRLQYWESVFFTGLFGAIALYPFTISAIPFILTDTPLFALLATTGIATFCALLFYFEYQEHRRLRWGIITAATAFIALLLGSVSAGTTSPQFLVWFLDLTFALLTFGYILVKHLFHPLEKDFRYRWPSIILTGLGINAAAFLLISTLFIFPTVFIAFVIASLFLVILL